MFLGDYVSIGKPNDGGGVEGGGWGREGGKTC